MLALSHKQEGGALSAAAPADIMLSVLIPVLNEEKGLAPLLARLVPVLEHCAQRWEVVFVDDGSTDRTFAALKTLNGQNPRIKCIRLSRNFGKEIAVAAGLRYTSGEAVMLMDGDLQHPPEAIPRFLEGWHAGYDVVYGQRLDRSGDAPSRRFLTKAFYRIFAALSGTKLPEEAGDFRLLSRRAADALNRIGERSRFNKGLFAWIGFSSLGIPFEPGERATGDRSRWPWRRLIRFALDGITSFTTIPLRIWSYLGLAISLLAFTYILVFIGKTLLFGSDVKGFPTLFVAILFFSGVQLISLGVIGEYLGRIYEEVKARPLFVVADELGLERQDQSPPASPTPAEVVARCASAST